MPIPGQPPVIARLTVRCCLADATPIGLPVVWPSGSNPQADQWLQVNGVMGIRRREGGLQSVVIADSVQPIAKPERPLEP